jgi:rhodanese-related sulfurtransferase
LHNPITINDDTFILVYCAGGYRSALAAKVLEDIGFKNVFNIGGFGEWISNGGEIEAIN